MPSPAWDRRATADHMRTDLMQEKRPKFHADVAEVRRGTSRLLRVPNPSEVHSGAGGVRNIGIKRSELQACA